MTNAKHLHRVTLDNGLDVVVYEAHRVPVVTFQVWYKVGSGYESSHQIGMSHFLEHIMFLGSKNKKMDHTFKAISEYGGMQNAFTSLDYTAYYETVNKSELENCVIYEADRMYNLLFNERAFNQEKKVILEERRLTVESDPYSRALEVFTAIAHLASPYRHPIIGWMDNIKAIELDNLQAWYRRWYNPNNATVIVAGDVEFKKTVQMINRYFGSIKSGPSPCVYTPTIETMSVNKRLVELSLPAGLPWIALGFNVPVLKTAELAWEVYALSLIGGLLAGSTSARICQRLSNKKQLAVGVTYRYPIFSRLDNVLSFTINPLKVEGVEKVQQVILEEIAKLHDQLVPTSELQKVKFRLLANRQYENNSVTDKAFEMGSFISVGFAPDDINKAIKQFSAITPQQIRAVARKYLLPDRSITTILYPA